jgi:hypothetical protein
VDGWRALLFTRRSATCFVLASFLALQNSVFIVLIVVVQFRREAGHAVLDHGVDLPLREKRSRLCHVTDTWTYYELFLRQRHFEAVLEGFYAGLSPVEAGQIGSSLHDFRQEDDLVHVPPGSNEALKHEASEIMVHIALDAAHDLRGKTIPLI